MGDRDLKLRGYEVYRFGAEELYDNAAEQAVKLFFGALFTRYRVVVPAPARDKPTRDLNVSGELTADRVSARRGSERRSEDRSAQSVSPKAHAEASTGLKV